MRAARDRTMQAHQEFRTALDRLQQFCQRRSVTYRKIARVLAAEQANRTIDARGEHRHASSDGFGYDVGSAFAQR